MCEIIWLRWLALTSRTSLSTARIHLLQSALGEVDNPSAQGGGRNEALGNGEPQTCEKELGRDYGAAYFEAKIEAEWHQIVTKTTFLNAFPPQPGEVYISQNINGHICMMLKLGTQHHDHGHPKILRLILPGNSLAWELAYFKDNFPPCGVKQHTMAPCRGNFVTGSPFWSLDVASFTVMLNLC